MPRSSRRAKRIWWRRLILSGRAPAQCSALTIKAFAEADRAVRFDFGGMTGLIPRSFKLARMSQCRGIGERGIGTSSGRATALELATALAK